MRSVIIAIVVAILTTTAAADDKADTLFKKGKKLLAEKRYADACPTFEKVDGLDPGIGAKLNVAKCYEEWGKLARAYRWYTDAARMASDANDKRGPKIQELIDQLDADVPRLTITGAPGADLGAAAVTLDGQKLATASIGTAMRVDPGPHEIAFEIDGKSKTETIALERGGSREVTVDPTTGVKAKDPAQDTRPKRKPRDRIAPRDPESGTPGRGRRIAGGVIAGAGIVGLGVATYLTLDARSSYRDALDAHCMGASNMCNDEGIRITHDAQTRANTATVIAAISGAAVIGGVVLYLTAPSGERKDKRTAYVAPVATGDGGGIVVGGRF